MDLTHALLTRRSTRKYLSTPLPESQIRQVLDAARWAPSWANTQGWHVFVVRGAAQAQKMDAFKHRRRGLMLCLFPSPVEVVA